MMFLATYNEGNERIAEVFLEHQYFFNKTFSPDTDPKIEMNFSLGNGSYKDKKNKLHDMAVEISHLISNLNGLTWYEMIIISNWFERNGKRYGLLREFRAEGIC